MSRPSPHRLAKTQRTCAARANPPVALRVWLGRGFSVCCVHALHWARVALCEVTGTLAPIAWMLLQREREIERRLVLDLLGRAS
jgi:hypothetical protein